jgi:hypothetical protein
MANKDRRGRSPTKGRDPSPDPAPGKSRATEEQASGSAPAGERRVRVTLDLARRQHRFLKRFAVDADADASSVLRVLLELLEEDASLADAVHHRVERRYQA